MKHLIFITIIAGLVPAVAVAQINWTEYIISDNVPNASDVFAIDIDGDGDVDVLSTMSNFVTDTVRDVIWWENDGIASFTPHTIDSTLMYAWSVYAIDINGDSAVDVLAAAGFDEDIIWWENDGDGNFTAHTIAENFDGATSVYAIDLDDDSDIDVLGASFDAGKITWWQSDGASPPNFTEYTIDDNFYGAFDVFAIDINGDSAVDVLGAAYDANEITWWENDGGSPPNFTEYTIDNTYDGARSVYAIDLDNDNDVDILGAAQSADDITWWENDGNNPPNFTEHTIDGNFYGACDVFAIDINGDDDIDVLGAAQSAGDIAWWENDGSTPPNFIENAIADNTGDARSVCAIDLDGHDGDIDVLAATNYNSIIWWESDLLDIYDAGVTSISIPSIVHPDTTLNPQTTVENFGTRAISFPVTCKIEPGGYASTRTIHNLTPGDSIQIEFFTEFTFESGSYAVTVFSRLSDDEHPLNDTLTKDINVVLNDVTPVSIDIPSTLPEDTTLNPHATIKNNGTNTETFSVLCTIDPGEYTSTTVSNIAASESIQVTFPDAFTFESGSYTVTVHTNLDIDEIPGNDTLEKVIDATGIAEEGSDAPISFSFGLKNNPVKGRALFNLSLPEAAAVTLRIYDVSGRLIENLVSGRKPAGHYEIFWDSKIASGVYFYKFQSPWKHEVGKLVLVR